MEQRLPVRVAGAALDCVHHFRHFNRNGLRYALDYYRQSLPAPKGFVEIRLSECERRVRLRDNGADFDTLRQIFMRYDYEIRRHAQSAPLVESMRDPATAPFVIDAGANIGLASVWFRLQSPYSEIVAIEPESGNFDLLVHNTAGLNVRCLKAAVWSERVMLNLTNPFGEANAFRTESGTADDAHDGLVPAVTLDELLPASLGSRKVIVKIDVEGAESDIFARNTGWLDRVDLLIVEIHDWMLPGSYSFSAAARALASRDVEYVIGGENMFCYLKRA
jgi:FkbM family methyltransferase